MLHTIIVVDALDSVDAALDVLTFEQYLEQYPKQDEPKTRIINLCDTQQYLSRGYYCSLLAEARKHKVFPSVTTINDLRDANFDRLMLGALSDGEQWPTQDTDIIIYFGWTEKTKWQTIARRVFERYPAPLLKVIIPFASEPSKVYVERIAIAQLNTEQCDFFNQKLHTFVTSVWRQREKKPKHRWDMAILVDPEETHPPSDKDAIKRFIKAANNLGINAELITAADADHIWEYDA